jgi:ribosomal protein L37AE/L43A
MPENQYKVVRCAQCETLTYKRVGQKVNRCPICHAKLEGEPLQTFADARAAIAYIKQQKLTQAQNKGGWFETFE